MILDIGSGHRPLKGSNVIHLDIEPRKIENFIRGSAEYLPFRIPYVFKKIYASHVLEHLKKPLQTLTSFREYALETEIRIPNLCYQIRDHDPHYYSWNEDTIRNLMNLVYGNCTIKHSFRIRGNDLINKLRIQGLIRILRMITKFEIIATSKV